MINKKIAIFTLKAFIAYYIMMFILLLVASQIFSISSINIWLAEIFWSAIICFSLFLSLFSISKNSKDELFIKKYSALYVCIIAVFLRALGLITDSIRSVEVNIFGFVLVLIGTLFVFQGVKKLTIKERN